MGDWRKRVLMGAALSGAALMSACALPASEPGATVHVADIINSVKCGLADAMQSEAGRRRLPGTIATVEMQLRVVDTRSIGVSSPSATTGLVILSWLGPTVLPTLSASNQQSFTVDTTINLTYKLDAPNVSVCSAPGVDLQDRFGFARWLGDVIAGLSKVTPNGPRGTLDKLTYDAAFAVTRDASVGGSVRVVFLSAGGSVDRARADTQHLRIVISGPKAVVSTLESVGPVARPIGSSSVQSLSSSEPAAR